MIAFGLWKEVPGTPFQDRLLEGYSKTSAQGRLERVLKGCTRHLRPWHGNSKHNNRRHGHLLQEGS